MNNTNFYLLLNDDLASVVNISYCQTITIFLTILIIAFKNNFYVRSFLLDFTTVVISLRVNVVSWEKKRLKQV